MKQISIIFFIVLLASCAGNAPLQPSQAQPLLGQEVYGLVLRVFEGVEADLMKSDACRKQDLLCMLTRQQGSGLQYATVQVYGSVAFIKTLVPRGSAEAGDIIRLKVAPRLSEAPVFLALGAKAKDRSAALCDWIDGRPSSFTGGVSCRGWSYKSLAGHP